MQDNPWARKVLFRYPGPRVPITLQLGSLEVLLVLFAKSACSLPWPAKVDETNHKTVSKTKS